MQAIQEAPAGRPGKSPAHRLRPHPGFLTSLNSLALALLTALLCATLARAHNAPCSALSLDFFRNHIQAELRLPLSELELSFRQPLLTPAVSPAELRARLDLHRTALTAYLLAHIDPRAPDGRPWLVTVTALSAALDDAIPDLVVHLRFTPPPGTPLRRFTLNYDVIVHEVINHITFVSVRRDWHHAIFAAHPEPLTPLRFFNKSLPLDRTGGSLWLGVRHRLLASFDRTPLRTSALLLAPLLGLAALASFFLRRRTAPRAH